MKTIIAIASALLCVSGIGGAHAGDADATRCPQGKSLVTAPGTGTKKVDNDQVSYVVEIRGFEPQVVIKSSSDLETEIMSLGNISDMSLSYMQNTVTNWTTGETTPTDFQGTLSFVQSETGSATLDVIKEVNSVENATLSSMNYGLSDETTRKAQAEALKAAVEDATSRGEAVTSASGGNFIATNPLAVRVTSGSVGLDASPSPVMMSARYEAEDKAGAGAGGSMPPPSAGTSTVRQSVQMSFCL